MEDVLEVYQRPYDPTIPQICMDEQPVQLIKEPRGPLPRAPGKPERYDYEYERNGTANIFMFSQPVVGGRRVSVREHKTAIDWAEEIRMLLGGCPRNNRPGLFAPSCRAGALRR